MDIGQEESTLNVDTEIKFVDTKTGKIAYRSSGTGPAMILCSRFRGNLDSWDPAFIAALSKNYRVITFDYVGFGSSVGTPVKTVLSFAENVIGLAEGLELGKFIVGGWSLGGFVAMIAMTEFPDLITHNIMIGTKPPGEVQHGIEQIFMDTAFKPYYDLEDETILFFEPTSEISRIAAKESHERMGLWDQNPDVRIGEDLFDNYMECGASYTADPYGARQKLIQSEIPVLVISADHEVCFPPENWFALNRKLPSTQVVVIPQSGHGVQHQYPDMVAAYIDAFIKNHQ